MALFELVTFYAWHWPYRHLLPARFRSLLLVKGILKPLVLVGITFGLTLISSMLAWLYVIAYTAFGFCYHYFWCTRNGIHPFTVQPREKYVLATTAWVDKLVAIEETRENEQ